MAGNEFVYFSRADTGDPDYGRLWNRIEETPQEAVIGSVEEGLGRIEREQAVLHVQAGQVTAFLQSNPQRPFQRIKAFGKEKRTFYVIIFPLNSPLQPLFERVLAQVRERGVEFQLQRMWEGADIGHNHGAELMVLSGGQVILVFAVMGGSLVICSIMFCSEMAVNRLVQGESITMWRFSRRFNFQ